MHTSLLGWLRDAPLQDIGLTWCHQRRTQSQWKRKAGETQGRKEAKQWWEKDRRQNQYRRAERGKERRSIKTN